MTKLVPPAMIAAALGVGATGLLDRWGLVGASQGLLLGAVICAPLWLLSLYRASKADRDHDPD